MVLSPKSKHKIDWGINCSTYSCTRLTGGTRVSWEADRTLQRDRDKKTEPDRYLTSCPQQLWQADSSTVKCDTVILLLTALIMNQSLLCVRQWSWHTGLPLGPSSPGGPRAPAGPAAPGGPDSPFSPVSPLGPWGEIHHTCHRDDHMSAIHATLMTEC